MFYVYFFKRIVITIRNFNVLFKIKINFTKMKKTPQLPSSSVAFSIFYYIYNENYIY